MEVKQKRRSSLSDDSRKGSKGSKGFLNGFIKPLNKETMINYYCPAIGAASYATLSISVLNPSFRPLLPKRDLTLLLISSSVLGVGTYIYTRPHIQKGDKNSQFIYSGLGATMFCFSSVLLWAILRSFLPENFLICSVTGVATSYGLAKSSMNYLTFVDGQSKAVTD